MKGVFWVSTMVVLVSCTGTDNNSELLDSSRAHDWGVQAVCNEVPPGRYSRNFCVNNNPSGNPSTLMAYCEHNRLKVYYHNRACVGPTTPYRTENERTFEAHYHATPQEMGYVSWGRATECRNFNGQSFRFCISKIVNGVDYRRHMFVCSNGSLWASQTLEPLYCQGPLIPTNYRHAITSPTPLPVDSGQSRG